MEDLESLDAVGEDKAAGSRTVYSWWMRLGLGVLIALPFDPLATENLSPPAGVRWVDEQYLPSAAGGATVAALRPIR